MNDLFRNICFAAHVDAGKTSLAEQILFQTGAVRKIGSVDEGSSSLDRSPIEVRRGITIFSEYASVIWKNCKINMIDTPGHLDFVSELERSLGVVDGVVIILSGIEGVQQHTEMIWELAQTKKIPVIFFINKTDRAEADLENVYEEIRRNLTQDAFFYTGKEEGAKDQQAMKAVGPSSDMIEFLAERDHDLLQKYVEEETITLHDAEKSLRTLIESCRIFPVLSGSARTGDGVVQLLEAMVDLLPSPKGIDKSGQAEASVRVFKVRNDEKNGKMAYVKVLSGQVGVRDSLKNAKNVDSKVAQIKIMAGNKEMFQETIGAGDIGILTGLKDVTAGEVLGCAAMTGEKPDIPRLLQTRIAPCNDSDWPQLQKAVSALQAEDPLLEYEWNPEGKEMLLHIMGTIHLEVLEELMKTRFGLEVILSRPIVKYYETVSNCSRGFCHFEPKKHYAEVEVEVEPAIPGSGCSYVSFLSTDNLPAQFQKAIEKAVPEALRHGSLTGSPVTDLQVKLIAGKHHLEHTHGGDFRIATIRAIQQALENNRVYLLEPIVSFRITIPKELSGRVISDVAKMKGTCNDPLIEGDYFIVTGEMPLATSLDYPLELTSFSGGKSQILMKPGGLQPCHNQEEILMCLQDDKMMTHRSEEDILYNSVSLFRAKRKMKKVINDRLFSDEECLKA